MLSAAWRAASRSAAVRAAASVALSQLGPGLGEVLVEIGHPGFQAQDAGLERRDGGPALVDGILQGARLFLRLEHLPAALFGEPFGIEERDRGRAGFRAQAEELARGRIELPGQAVDARAFAGHLVLDCREAGVAASDVEQGCRTRRLDLLHLLFELTLADRKSGAQLVALGHDLVHRQGHQLPQSPGRETNRASPHRRQAGQRQQPGREKAEREDHFLFDHVVTSAPNPLDFAPCHGAPRSSKLFGFRAIG